MNAHGIKLDISACWADALALWRANAEIVLILGGLFLFLPSLIATLVMGNPPVVDGMRLEQMQAIMLDWLQENWLYLLMSSLLSMVGTLAILFVALNPAKPTVGEALGMAASVLIFYLAAQILASLAIGFGFMLLIVPGVYLAIKFSLSAVVAAAENERNPIAMLRRSWALTKGNSVMLFILLLLVSAAALVAMVVATLIFSIGFSLILPVSAATMGIAFVDTLLQTLFALLMLHIYMGVYRQLSGSVVVVAKA